MKTMKYSNKLILTSLLVLILLIPITATSVQASSTCTLQNGCILRENGSNSQWWADSWRKGTCRDHPANSQDWIVTYKVNNNTWRNADPTKVRFYAAWWSLAQIWKWSDMVQVENNALARGGGITICLSGVLRDTDVKGTYLWLKR
jgi:hypothetical protein